VPLNPRPTFTPIGSYCYIHWKDCDSPTQTLYLVPTSVLKPTGNEVVIFEETANIQTRSLDSVALVALHEHPSHD
jgi:hypothetical protein